MKTKITFFNSGKSKGVNLDDIDYFYFWENDHRKDNAVYMGLKNDNSESIYVLKKSTDLTKLIRERGVRFYTCDDDYEDGDDYRYGYYYNPSNKDGLDFEPLDQMEGDGHVHMFYKNEEGKYKQL
jgi:hypothetical protein